MQGEVIVTTSRRASVSRTSQSFTFNTLSNKKAVQSHGFLLSENRRLDHTQFFQALLKVAARSMTVRQLHIRAGVQE